MEVIRVSKQPLSPKGGREYVLFFVDDTIYEARSTKRKNKESNEEAIVITVSSSSLV